MAGLLAALLLVVIAAAYWAVTGPDTLLLRDDNPRRVEAEAAILRGNLYDRNETPLVKSVQSGTTGQSVVLRNYLESDVYGIIGYHSLRYGVGGAEAAFNTVLRGDDLLGHDLARDLNMAFAQEVLHQPQQGSDVRLTLDLPIQRLLRNEMKQHHGAGVILSARGEVLAMVSLPTYDPSTLDAQWESLVAAPDTPFFNRALQGRYQPGGIIQTPLITAALIAGYSIDEVMDDAARSITISTQGRAEDITLECATRPPANRLTVSEAFAFTCPGPFADLFTKLGEGAIMQALDLFGLRQSYTLPGFVAEPLATATPTQPDDLTIPDMLGQGDLTITPLDAAVMVATIINEGNAPQPTMLLATRPPESSQWIAPTTLRESRPVTTAETARILQKLMRDATVNGSARRAARTDVPLGGQVALVYSGDRIHTWFVGYAITGQNHGVALAVLLEDYADPEGAAEIGGRILEATYRRLVSTD